MVSTQFFFAKFPDFPWFFGTQVPWLSLTSARSELQGSHIFSTSKFKEFQGENLHNFTEILFMNKITFVASFSTPTYDVRWMCFNFTHNLMNIVGSIDLHNSLQTFSTRMVWQLRTLKWRTMLYKTKTQYQEYIIHQGTLSSYFLKY